MGRLAITIATLVALVVAGYLIVSGGSGQHAHARTTPSVLPPAQQAAGTTTHRGHDRASEPTGTHQPSAHRPDKQESDEHRDHGDTDRLPLAPIPRRRD